MQIKRALLYLWQLPQHLAAGLLYLVLRLAGKLGGAIYYRDSRIFLVSANFGVSLGDYIFLFQTCNETDRAHEYGHCIQSRFFGPLYLLIIGLPSLLGNIWDRLFHRAWSPAQRIDWYYRRYPEHWADRLGGASHG
jgi:hypothetical protein